MSIDLLSLRNYPGQDPSIASASEPPASIVPDAIRQALPTKFRKAVIKPIGGSSVSSGQPLEFQTNFSNGSFLKAGSMYIIGTLTPTGLTSGQTWGFKGSAGNSNRLWSRCTVSYGSQVIEDLNFYNQYATDVVAPFLASAQNENVQAALFNGSTLGINNHLAFSVNTGASRNYLSIPPGEQYAHNATPRVCIPIQSSFLNGGIGGEDIPLFALSSPISIRFLMDAINNICTAPAGTISALTLSDISLVYTEIVPDASYVATLIQAMNTQGKMFPISINTYNSFKPALTSSYSVLQSVNARSVNAVAVCFNPQDQNNGLAGKGYCKSPTGSTASDTGNLSIFLDNDLVNQYPDRMIFASDKLGETVSAIYGNLQDSDISLPFSAISSQNFDGTYMGQYYTVIVSTQCYHDSDTVKRGLPCSQLRVEGTYSNAQSGDVLTIFTLYEKIVFFGAMGSMQVVQ